MTHVTMTKKFQTWLLNAMAKYSKWNWKWNLDSALRYSKIVTIMTEKDLLNIVEIGSGNRGISAYTTRNSYGVDLSFDTRVESGLQTRVIASGESLPFCSQSMDIALSVDMLEHVDNEIRKNVIEELFRVIKLSGVVYITFPTGRAAEEADRKIDKAYKKRHGMSHPMLKDHLQHSLPDLQKIRALVANECEKIGFELDIFWNTPVWIWYWNLKIFGVMLLRHFQRILLQPLFPMIKRLKNNTNYRVILFASHKNSNQ